MKQFKKWVNIYLLSFIVSVIAIAYGIFTQQWVLSIFVALALLISSLAFFNFYNDLKEHGMKTELDISRVLGKDAKDALKFGNIGILTYDQDGIVTWTSDYFADHDIDIVNKKLTSWIDSIRELFDDEVDMVIGKYNGVIYEITRKEDARLLYVHDITDFYQLRQDYLNNEVVIGLMQLDNYMEYQSYENEEIIANINTHLRSPLISWAKENGMFIRRIRSDRFLVILNQKIFKKVKEDNFSILQIIKDKALALDVSITLSMAFAYGTSDFTTLDDMVNELIELAQSRGGDQAAIRAAGGSVQFVGGNSETGSMRSKVRVRIMAQTIQEAINDAQCVYIAGHTMSDFDCVGAALSMSNWATSLHKKAYIVLKDVPRDGQLQTTMNFYSTSLQDRHEWITPAEAMQKMDYEKDLLIMVDHSIPAISSAKDFIDQCRRILVIDHHRRNENFVKNTMLTYVESTASSASELIVELLQNIPNHIPIYEAEATIMYLGIMVDTNRFKMHTDSRTFEASAALRSWGANAMVAEKALCEDYPHFIEKHQIIQMAQPYYDHFMIACVEDRVLDRTLMSQVSDSLLLIKGCKASFTIALTSKDPAIANISARGDGSVNVQKIMEKMHGGGHFSAAALERKDITVKDLKNELLKVIKEEYDESNNA